METHKGIVYKVANSYCKDEESRKDLIQEIFVQLWLALGQYDPKYKLSTWMYRIALNVSISFYRKEKRRDEIRQPLSPDILTLPESPQEPLNEEVVQLHRFIRGLKELDRAIMLLYLDEKPQAEIAEILGMTTTNVSTRIGRIKEQLKRNFSSLNN